MAVVVNYETVKGNTFSTTLTVTDANTTDPTNLTGATVVMTILDRNGDQLSQTTQTTHDDPTNGVTTITIDKAVTATYPMGCFDFGTTVTLASGTSWTIEKGTINVRNADDE